MKKSSLKTLFYLLKFSYYLFVSPKLLQLRKKFVYQVNSFKLYVYEIYEFVTNKVIVYFPFLDLSYIFMISNVVTGPVRTAALQFAK